MSSKNAVDRFDLLPDHILEDIFFRLPWDDAAHMTVMSKAWSNIWSSLRVFDCLDLNSDRISRFINNVDVANGKVIVKKLRLRVFVTDPGIASCVDRCLEVAVKNFVGELVIENGSSMPGSKQYVLPCTTMLAKPLHVLRLNQCELEQPLNDDNMKYTYLRELYLSNVKVDDAVFVDFMHRCPALVYLFIWNCKGLKSLLIPPLPKLEKLRVHPSYDYESGFEKINIEAMNIKSFHYEAWDGCEINQTFGDFFVNWTHLTTLTIKCAVFTDGLLEGLLCKLPLLQDLTLSRCFMIDRVKISHSSLRRLFLDPFCELEQLEIETPNLLVFQYDDDIDLPKLFTINAPNLKESCLRITPRDYLDTDSFLRLRRYISNFDQLNVLAIRFWRMEAISFESSLLDNLNEFEIHSIPVVKHLLLQAVPERLKYESILNGLFWVCHPEILTVTDSPNLNKFLREKLPNRDKDAICCDSGGFRCWRHFLKDVVMEEIEGTHPSLNSLPRGIRGPLLLFHLKW